MASLPDVHVTEIKKHYSGDIDDFEQPFLEGKLGEVVDQINVRWGTLVESRLNSGALPTRLYNAVVVRVAARVFENPEGYRKENEGGYGYEINPAVGSGTLWFTDTDIEDLTGQNPKRPAGRIGTATIGRHRTGWV